MKTKEIVEQLVSSLGSKKKTIASLLGVTATTLSMNIEKPVSEVKTNKFGKRLLSLLYVVESLSKDTTLTPKVILHIITTPRYSMSDGTILDVISAIHLGNYPNEFLIEIAQATIDSLREKYKKNKAPSKQSLYSQAISE